MTKYRVNPIAPNYFAVDEEKDFISPLCNPYKEFVHLHDRVGPVFFPTAQQAEEYINRLLEIENKKLQWEAENPPYIYPRESE